ncbi:4-hydroxy-tetrahydrodipicolinate reductase, partial [bacterium]|nr:4-hydroxy-tetrahydrodipicolinate reductase [bacterium]
MIRVVVCGGCGKMASLAATYILADHLLQLVGIIESSAHPACGKDWGETIGKGKTNIIVQDNLKMIIGQGDVVVDFTNPEASIAHLAV